MSRSLFPALMLLVAGAVAGCGGSSETAADDRDPAPAAQADAPPLPPVGPPAAAGLSEPVLPPSAQVDGKAGAEAFVAYYWRLVAYAGWSGDTAGMEAVAESGCFGCIELAGVLEKLHATKQRIRTEQVDVSVSDMIEIGDNWDLTADVTTDATLIEGGEAANKPVGGTKSYWMIVTFDDGWKVVDVLPT